MGRKSINKLMKKLEDMKEIAEEEKESLKKSLEQLKKEKNDLIAEIGSSWNKRNSIKKLMEKVGKKKDISTEERDSLLARLEQLQKDKNSLVSKIDGKEKHDKEGHRRSGSHDPSPEGDGSENEQRHPMPEGRRGPEVPPTSPDELQRKVDELQEKLNKQEVELEWRKTHRYADNITLDADTAHPNLSIAEDKKSLTHEVQPQKVQPAPERFDSTVCVLGSQGFSNGKHYWEVEIVDISDWDLGVANKSIQRQGKLLLCPKERFWVLGLNGRDYWAKTDPWTQVKVQKKPKKIGVYLSYEEGQVTFFNVTDMSVLFTFKDCSFSGEVCPFFKNSHKGTTLRICSIGEEEGS